MTTVASNGKAMAGDGRVTSHNRVVREDLPKITKETFLGTEGELETLYIGFAGYWNWKGDMVQFVKDNYLGDGVFTEEIWNPDVPETMQNDEYSPQFSEGLVLLENGKLYHVAYLQPIFEVPAPFAIGSGCEFAMGAMACGKEPWEAVRIASRFDVGTNTPVQTVSLSKGK